MSPVWNRGCVRPRGAATDSPPDRGKRTKQVRCRERRPRGWPESMSDNARARRDRLQDRDNAMRAAPHDCRNHKGGGRKAVGSGETLAASRRGGRTRSRDGRGHVARLLHGGRMRLVASTRRNCDRRDRAPCSDEPVRWAFNRRLPRHSLLEKQGCDRGSAAPAKTGGFHPWRNVRGTFSTAR